MRPGSAGKYKSLIVIPEDDEVISRHNTPSYLEESVNFHKNILDIDPAVETERMVKFLHDEVRVKMRRYGAVVGITPHEELLALEGRYAAMFRIQAQGFRGTE